jgi:hypothetical protein
VSGQLHIPAALPPGERAPGTHWIGSWEDPRAGLTDMEKWKFLTPPGLELRPLGRPARSQSLYRLRYPGSRLNEWMEHKHLIEFEHSHLTWILVNGKQARIALTTRGGEMDAQEYRYCVVSSSVEQALLKIVRANIVRSIALSLAMKQRPGWPITTH